MKNKNNVIIGVVVLVIILGLVGYVVASRNKEAKKPVAQTQESDVIPTVDASVKVDLVGLNNNKKVKMTIDGIPAQTTSIDYSISYETADQGSQGIIGDGVEIKSGQKQYEVQRELGTCSSGTCIYHNVVGKIRLEIKFNGGYGEKLFEKEFEL